MRRVVIVDYGSGNLLSVLRAFEKIEACPLLVSDPAQIVDADRLVLPGVGAFGDCLAQLKQRKLYDAVRKYAGSGRPFLGICVGMQMLFDQSTEFGVHPGFGLIPGRVERLSDITSTGARCKVPHVGWGALSPPSPTTEWQKTILSPVEVGQAVYFVHSYAGQPAELTDCLAQSDYMGQSVCAVVKRDHLYGCQFHPEKSGPVGLKILGEFMAL
jgi:glutamine amidotransferase